MQKKLTLYLTGAIMIWMGCVLSPESYAQIAPEPVAYQRISQFSGKIVPRFESLRASEVNGRVGPSLDHPIRWHYKRVGLPVLVVMETRDWSKVRDPDGAEVWIFNQLLSSKQTAISRHATILRANPSETSKAKAKIVPKVVLDVTSCNESWCRVKAGRHKGWVKRANIWGATKIDPSA